MSAGFIGILGATGVGAAAVPPMYCPQGETMDPLALFTHGEFESVDNDCESLLLFTHGEFPRPVVPVTPTGVESTGAPASVGVGSRRRRSRRTIYPEIIYPRREEEIIALAVLLAADDDDDWW